MKAWLNVDQLIDACVVQNFRADLKRLLCHKE